MILGVTKLVTKNVQGVIIFKPGFAGVIEPMNLSRIEKTLIGKKFALCKYMLNSPPSPQNLIEHATVIGTVQSPALCGSHISPLSNSTIVKTSLWSDLQSDKVKFTRQGISNDLNSAEANSFVNFSFESACLSNFTLILENIALPEVRGKSEDQ